VHGGDEYERLLCDDTLVLQLHRFDVEHHHGRIGDPSSRPYGNGVALWFEIDDWLDLSWRNTTSITEEMRIMTLKAGFEVLLDSEQVDVLLDRLSAYSLGVRTGFPRGTIAVMDAVKERERLTMNGRHHEIYATPVTEQRPAQETKTNLRRPVQTLDH
jgi:hypothetical protein